VLSDLCVRRPVFATMLVMSLVVLGTFSFRNLGVDLFPKADPATVSVTLTLPGASPDEMSTSVVEPMEEAISGVSGIDELQSRMAEGRATVTVRFVLERDINDASNDVREKVASAIRNMPPALLPPVITKVDPDADPVMSLKSAEASTRPSVLRRSCPLPCSTVPPGTSIFSATKASRTWVIERPYELSFSTSTTIWISRARPPSTLTSPTPLTV